MKNESGAFSPDFSILINLADNRYSLEAESIFLNNKAMSLLFARYGYSDDGQAFTASVVKGHLPYKETMPRT